MITKILWAGKELIDISILFFKKQVVITYKRVGAYTDVGGSSHRICITGIPYPSNSIPFILLYKLLILAILVMKIIKLHFKNVVWGLERCLGL